MKCKIFFGHFFIFFHPWLLSIAILMIKVFSKSRILQKKIFPIWNFYFRLTEVIFRNYFILARESPKILFKVCSVHDKKPIFHLWQWVLFFIEAKILIIFLHSSAVIAVIQGKLKIENSSMKANLDMCLYDSQLGLYLDPYCLYWLYISSKFNNTWKT